MKTDPAIEPTRDVRRAISAAVGDDPARLIDYYRKMEARFVARLRPGPPAANGQVEAAEQARPADVR